MAVHPLPVLRVWDETPGLRGIALLPDDAVRRGHTAPGQYLRVAPAPGLEGLFAIASAPAAAELELLVKRGAGKAGDALAAAAPGRALPVRLPEGRGFPIEAARGHDLLLFAAGSGIAAIASVLGHVAAHRPAFGAVHLFYGQREPADFAYAGARAAWRRAGIDVTLVASGAAPGWTGARGHVQDVLLAAAPPVADAVACVCGMKAMVRGVTQALATLGLPAERVFLNH